MGRVDRIIIKNRDGDGIMQVNIMSWNTRLYEYGNQINVHKSVMPIDYGRCIDSINIIREHMEKENAIVLLQEIPLRCNTTNTEHIIWTILRDVFPTTQYSVLYNVNESAKNQIKTTVVIGKKNFVQRDTNGVNSSSENYCNCFVSFKIPSIKLAVLAVHQSLNRGGYVSDKLNSNYSPDMIIGDFNAGNYKKNKETDEFIKNRKNYNQLIDKGYEDLCNGEGTRYQKSNGYIYKTPIDHILIKNELIENNAGQNISYRCECNIDENVTFSDHYPIYCTINYEETNGR